MLNASAPPAAGCRSFIHLLWVTYEQKLLKKYGLDLEYIAIENGTVGMQALLANEAQFLFSTSSLAVNANLARIRCHRGRRRIELHSGQADRPPGNHQAGGSRRQALGDQPLRLFLGNQRQADPGESRRQAGERFADSTGRRIDAPSGIDGRSGSSDRSQRPASDRGNQCRHETVGRSVRQQMGPAAHLL